MGAERARVGEVIGLSRFPVKAMGGEALAEVKLGWHGLHGDRRYAFVKDGDKSGFPWLTIRDLPLLAAYRAAYEGAQANELVVRSPSGATYGIEDDALARELSARRGAPVRLLHHFGGVFDAMDVSLITAETVAALGATIGADVSVDRFRANIVVQAGGAASFPEDKWVDGLLVFGDRPDSARLGIKRKDARCKVVDVCPATGQIDMDLASAVATTRGNKAGVYGSTDRPGTIRLGDVVWWAR